MDTEKMGGIVMVVNGEMLSLDLVSLLGRWKKAYNTNNHNKTAVGKVVVGAVAEDERTSKVVMTLKGCWWSVMENVWLLEIN